MLKKFFISMLGSMAAIWLSLFILFVGSFIAIGIIAVKAIGTDTISGDKILYINLSGAIAERASDMTFTELLSSVDSDADDLESILTAIRKAADDKSIKGIYLDCAGSELGVASRSEIIEQLKKFRDKGKWVYAYADNFAQGDYYIASAADKIYLNPVGMLDVHGLSSTVMFYKDVLDKLGIDINVVRVGSYKSAVEPYIRMDMSEASRQQTNIFLTNIWDDITASIADNRGISASSINMWADSLSMTWAPQRYEEQKAVTGLMYRENVEQLMRSLLGLEEYDELPLITPTDYLATKETEMLAKADKPHIAVLYAVGDIVDSGSGGIVSETMVPEIISLAADEKVQGLILRVNSGGGSAFASEQIWNALNMFKDTGRPFYVSMGDYAASGGYYISCGADKIFCDPATLTGSIGIFGIIPNAEKLLKNKIGLGFSTVETNKNATFPSLYYAPTAEQLQGMQQYVERGYDVFTSRVAEGRGIPVDSVKAIGGGRVWDGQSALKIGLVDELGTLNDALVAMANELSLDIDDYVSYPKSDMSFLNTLLKSAPKNISVDVEGIPAEEIRQYAATVKKIKEMDPLQARMEPVILR